ncbi:MAG TPA: MFS transporter [Polyangia bacterium]|nr:MFS transporter [Polyangia bacterium]
MTAGRRAAPAFRLLVTRDFGLLWLGETISQIGDSLNRVALLWFAYETSRSTLRMSLVGVMQTLPALLLGPLIGVYLDRLRKKPALVAVSLVRAIVVSAVPVLHAAHLLSLNLLYLLVLVLSVVGSVAGPALATAVPLLVTPAELTGANGLIAATATIGVLLGPGVAGVGIAWLGISRVLYVDAASFVVFAVCVAFIRLPERAPAEPVPLHPRALAGDLRAGLVFLARQQVGILLLTLVAGLQNIGASAFVFMLPAFVRREVEGGSVWLGLLWSAFGLGMLLASTSLAMVRRASVSRLLWIALASLVVGGVAIPALSLVKVKLAAAILMVVIGWSAAAFSPVVISLVQGCTPVDLRARVLTAFNSANMAAVTVGMLAFGWAADRLGEDLALRGIGGVLLLTALALGALMRVQVTRRMVENLAVEP